ncbi:hypothetical protein ACIBCT_11150 [Streptosporangium sp. NPDC050855]|uniref:hypothetical protein n=1 Tax=Streptosporangium sp. NPDC050855 TaxID=3366194 RepID=UPI0037AE3D55
MPTTLRSLLLTATGSIAVLGAVLAIRTAPEGRAVVAPLPAPASTAPVPAVPVPAPGVPASAPGPANVPGPVGAPEGVPDVSRERAPAGAAEILLRSVLGDLPALRPAAPGLSAASVPAGGTGDDVPENDPVRLPVPSPAPPVVPGTPVLPDGPVVPEGTGDDASVRTPGATAPVRVTRVMRAVPAG